MVARSDGLTAVAPGIQMLAAFGSWVFFLEGSEAALVDSGRRGGAKRILQTLAEDGFAPRDVRTLVVTHHHLDHTGSLAALQEATGARVAAHRLEAPLVAGEEPLPNPFQPPLLAKALQPLVAFGQPTPVNVEVLLEDGDPLPGLPEWQVLHTPGHTAGSICLWREKDGVLIAGDAMEYRSGRLGPPSKIFSVDMEQAKTSVARLASLDVNVLCLSHFPPIADGAGILLRALANSF
jgi:glyoxylase-like metal-dependent hydrolase (beta-lactamase superfamily II)